MLVCFEREEMALGAAGTLNSFCVLNFDRTRYFASQPYQIASSSSFHLIQVLMQVGQL